MSRAKKGVEMFQQFFNSEKAGGLILIACTIISLLVANSSHGEDFVHFWHTDLSLHAGSITIPFSLEEWINDGLMTIFFLMVGLEIERELYIGELSSFKNAILPAMAAIGGMAIPALIHYLFCYGKPEAAGNGIPTATDIAFSLGVLSLIGKRIPLSLKIFLTALAIIDDLGAIIIIGIFYTQTFSFLYLGFALLVFAVLLIFNKLKFLSLWAYLPAGILLWYFLYRSGVHPTLSGVSLAFAIPFSKNNENQPSYKLQHALHNPVNFIIIPLFALANTAIHLDSTWKSELLSANSLGIELGLLLGKPIGIVGFTLLGILLGIAKLPGEINIRKLVGLGMLAGIGFTMSIFISTLAFSDNPDLIQSSKVAVLVASLIAAVLGWVILKSGDKKMNEAKY
ncbi:MAG TPA: Na+/H+ antiporter NhaA [Puia sp.]|nr:Na+/H+ antiporter NhaA [Puia sp.]